ncbi:centromere protein U [Sparus aurata]|uniref:Centromere protein U n=1 Tax=Sparus aurata TaxID=8175 RepID=A0A671VBD0_SPAAU|nr:centromere protein U [Sparus aurata]
MSSKKGRAAKLRKEPQHDAEKQSRISNMDSPNLSAINKISFLEGLQQNYDKPLHSTALEEDLNVPEEEEEEQVNKGKARQKDTAEKKKRSTGRKVKASPLKKQQLKKSMKRDRGSGSGKSSDPRSQEESDIDTTQQKRRRVLSSDEEVVDEDTSWVPSPKKARVLSFATTRKSSSNKSKTRTSSSGSASADAEKARTDKQRRRGHHGGTQLEVVLDAFLDFCEQYRDSVESTAVKQSIDSFSINVREQLLEKISSYKNLKVLKRDNAKVGSLIRKKTQKLLDAKYELMRAEREVQLLLKEKGELKLRLTDLRRAQAFLQDIKELNRKYLDYRHEHPKEKETYGASSLPALLLEAKHVQTAEHQMRGINNQLKKRLK